jgi:WD40 repeat protein
VFAIGISANGDNVMSGDAKGELINWNYQDGNVKASFLLNKKEITAIKFFPDGSKVVASSYDGTVRIFDLDAGQPEKTFWLNMGQISAVAITPTLDSIFIGTSMGLVARINVFDESILWKREANIRGITDVDLSANGEYIATASLDGAVEIACARTGDRIKTIYPPLPNNVLALSMHKVKMSKDDTYVLCGCEDGSVYCWEWNTGKLAHRFVGHKGSVTGVDIDNSGSYLYSAAEDGTVKVWDFMRNQVIAQFTAEGPVCSCAVSSAGDKIIIGEQSGRIHFLKYNNARYH